MIERIIISGIHYKPTEELHKYVIKKISKLDSYIQRPARKSVHADVKLKEGKSKDKKQYTCEVVVHLPHEELTVHETTFNMFAAVDIVEAKLKNQLKRYKDKHSVSRRRALTRKLIRKVRRPNIESEF